MMGKVKPERGIKRFLPGCNRRLECIVSIGCLMKFARNVFGAVRLGTVGLLLCAGLTLSACQGGIDSVFPKAEKPIPERLLKKMKAKGMTVTSPILLRIYKSENVLEVWKQKDTGRYDLLESYEICKWSGKLGPKFKEGDRQAPEGFYKVGKAQLNPNSDYHLSFNIGFPNTFDRAHGRTGSHLMVHGACSSAGCYSMTDERVEEIYALARDAIRGGQDYFQVQAFPFRMTAGNLAKNVTSPHFDFWKSLKEGSDHFELTNYPPKVDVCERRYVFNREAVDDARFVSTAACPPVTMPAPLLTAYKERLEQEKAEFEKALRREKARAKLNGSEMASINVDSISLIAPGSETLPPPTPEPEPLVAENPSPSKTTVTTAPEEKKIATSQQLENLQPNAVSSDQAALDAASAPAIDGGLGSQAATAEIGLAAGAVPIPVPAPLQ